MVIRTFFLISFILASSFSTLVYSKESPDFIKGAITIGVEEAKELYDQGILFIDVRRPSEWQQGHVKGAWHLDLKYEFSQLRAPESINRDTSIVLYCNSPECFRGAFASYLAVSWGYNKVYFFREGYFSWMAKDYPVKLHMTAMRDY